MTIQLRSINDKQILEDALDETEVKADRIAGIANRSTSAPVGITTERKEDHILIGPTGAAGLPVEIGTLFLPAHRFFKAALDSDRNK